MRRLEVAEHTGRELLNAVEERPDRSLHLGPVGDDLVGERVLQIGVDQLVGVEVRGVGGQEMQIDPVVPVGDPFPDLLGAVWCFEPGLPRSTGEGLPPSPLSWPSHGWR